jgi:hypothetical protein
LVFFKWSGREDPRETLKRPEAISKIEKWFEVKDGARIVTGGIYVNILRITIQAGLRDRAIWHF